MLNVRSEICWQVLIVFDTKVTWEKFSIIELNMINWFDSIYRIIHDNGFTDEDHRRFKPVIYSNTIMSLIAIIKAMDKLKIDIGDEKRAVSRQIFLKLRKNGVESKVIHCVKVSIFGVSLVRIFPHSDWIQRDTERPKLT